MANLFQKAAEQQPMPGQDPSAVPMSETPDGDQNAEPGPDAASDPAPQDGTQDDGGDPDPNNPAYLKAKELAMSKLYEEGAGKEIAAALQKAPSLLQGLVEQSLVLFSSVDEATNGSVPDNLLLLLGLDMLNEVAEIASSAGLPVDSKTIAAAVQKFILAVVQDLGGDTSQVEQAMSQLDPGQVGSALDQASRAPQGA